MDIGIYHKLLFLQLIVGTVCDYPYDQCENCDCCAGECDVANNYACDSAGCIDYYWGTKCSNRCWDDYPCVSCGRGGGLWCTTCGPGYYVPTSPRNDATQHCTYKCNSRCETCTVSPTNCQDCKDGYENTDGITDCSFYTCPSNCEACSSGIDCSECKPGFYDLLNTCDKTCLPNCLGCNHASTCTECKPGFTGNTCDSCVTGKYGMFCNFTCSSTCQGQKCIRNSGFCTEGCVSEDYVGNSCERCKVERYGTTCNQMCPINCKGSTCSKNTGICTDGCNGNFAGETCTYCITGMFGDTCTKLCPDNCFNDTCDKTAGLCLSCKPNYAGEKCEECAIGYYGQTCNQACSTGCLNSVCNRTTGVCLSGCINNYSGDKCCLQHGSCALCSSTNECSRCVNGFYGTLCNDVCSNSCLDGQCEMENGYCTKCPPNMFGEYCEYNCPENCSPGNNASLAKSNCNQKSGECIHGCEPGTFGLHCNISCSQNCADSVCDKTNGLCVKEFHGPTCSEETFTVPATTLYGILGVLCLTVLVIIVLIIYIWRLRRNQDQAKQKQQANVVQYSNVSTDSSQESIGTANVVHYSNFPTDSTRDFVNATGTIGDSASSYEILDMTSSDNTNVYSTINSDN